MRDSSPPFASSSFSLEWQNDRVWKDDHLRVAVRKARAEKGHWLYSLHVGVEHPREPDFIRPFIPYVFTRESVRLMSDLPVLEKDVAESFTILMRAAQEYVIRETSEYMSERRDEALALRDPERTHTGMREGNGGSEREERAQASDGKREERERARASGGERSSERARASDGGRGRGT